MPSAAPSATPAAAPPVAAPPVAAPPAATLPAAALPAAASPAAVVAAWARLFLQPPLHRADRPSARSDSPLRSSSARIADRELFCAPTHGYVEPSRNTKPKERIWSKPMYCLNDHRSVRNSADT